jgi:ATP-binding cassette subfamily B (MDR/TAP) protein 1
MGTVLEVTKRKPLVDGLAETGDKPVEHPKGKIELRNVDFAYPSRLNVNVCQGYNLIIRPGETVALCGPSGAGKSTIMNLLLRFYDPLKGSVLLDDMDIKSLNVRWLRNSMGYVGQEPVLFAGTIAENIAYGVDTQLDGVQDALTLRGRVEAAAKLANAHNFISAFPEGYDTDVGANGGSMSGGQKQRIAIARALIKHPAVLLLDEATSALDAASERIVQQSIDRLQESKAQTTLIIAHRLSTIRNADRIAVVSEGRVVELGTHDELLALNGLYSDLVSLQMSSAEDGPMSENSSATGYELAVAAAIRGRESTVDPIPDPIKEIDLISCSTDRKISNKYAVTMDDEIEVAPSKEEAKELRKRIYGLLYHHIWWLLSGLLGAAMVGAAFPIWGLLLATVQDMFYYTDTNALRVASVTVATRFIMLGIDCLIGYTLQYYCIAQVGQRISTVLRSEMFESFMRRDIGFYDEEENAVGALTTRLADDTRLVHEATGETFSNQLQAVFTLAVGLIIGFTASWKITLVVMATFPINIAAGAMRMAERSGQHGDSEKDDKKSKTAARESAIKVKKMKSMRSLKNLDGENEIELAPIEAKTVVKAVKGGEGALISSAFTHMRTISAFSMQYEVSKQYGEMTSEVSIYRQRRSYYSGFIFGVSQATMYFCYALLFWYGGKFQSQL